MNVIIYFQFARNIIETNNTVARKYFYLNKQCCSCDIVQGREGREHLLSSVLGEKIFITNPDYYFMWFSSAAF